MERIHRRTEVVEGKDRVDRPRSGDSARQQFRTEIPGHGGDVTSHLPIIQIVEERSLCSPFCRMPRASALS